MDPSSLTSSDTCINLHTMRYIWIISGIFYNSTADCILTSLYITHF